MATPFKRVSVRSDSCADLGSALDALRPTSTTASPARRKRPLDADVDADTDTDATHSSKRHRGEQPTGSEHGNEASHVEVVAEERELELGVEGAHELRGSGLPFDWSLKRRVRLSCRRRAFAWATLLGCEALPHPEAPARCRPEGAASLAGERCGQCTDGGTDAADTALAMAMAAMRVYASPAVALPAEMLQPAAASALPCVRLLLASLHEQWKRGLRSLVALLLCQQPSEPCAYFYHLHGSEFAVLFKAAGIARRDVATAVLSPSNTAMRASLAASGITFTTPMMAQSSRDAELPTLAVEHNRDIVVVGVREEPRDGTPASVVEIEGDADVERLAQWLLDRKPPRGQLAELLSPVPFTEARLCVHHVVHNHAVVRAVGNSFETTHVLEIAGSYLLPSTVHQLCTSAMRLQHGANMQIEFTSEHNSSAFNVSGGASSAAAAARDTAAEECSDVGVLPTSDAMRAAPVLGPTVLQRLSYSGATELASFVASDRGSTR